MSHALYQFGGLRFWTQDEIELRRMFEARVVSVVKATLSSINPAWRFAQVEGPCLTPRANISEAYSDDDIFLTNHEAGGQQWALRAETTHSSYAYARHLDGKLPLCVYQSGKSFRRETNDGASAAKLRFNEFHQLEFQCMYAASTKADYRSPLIEAVSTEIARFAGSQTRTVESDRLPAYSTSTIDIEASTGGKWREMASCSIRTDFGPDTLVCEIAIGLDRVATLAGGFNATAK